ncbi:MAG: hypothetical protein WA813_13345 [Beijerinckiaceae bacterium]
MKKIEAKPSGFASIPLCINIAKAKPEGVAGPIIMIDCPAKGLDFERLGISALVFLATPWFSQA